MTVVDDFLITFHLNSTQDGDEYAVDDSDADGIVSHDDNETASDRPFEEEPYRKKIRRDSNTLFVRKSHPCKQCEKSFSHSSSLSKHKRTIHDGIRTIRRCSAERHNENMISHSEDKPYACNLCENSYKLPSMLTKHVQVVHQKHPFICDVCEKGCGSRWNLQKHMYTHTNERP